MFRSSPAHLLMMVSTALAVGGPARAELPGELEIFDWRCNLSGTYETGKIYRALLTPEVYDGFRSFPLDLRLVDKDGTPWACFIWSRPDRSAVVPIRHTALDPVAPEEGGDGFTRREFQLDAEADGSYPVHNRVIISAGSREQARRVEVWGGPSREDLERLGTGYLVEQKTPAPVRNRAIDYPDSRWPFLEVRVFPDVRQPEAPLEWRTTEIARHERDDADHETLPLERMDAPEGEVAAEGVLVVYLDVGTRNRPLLSVSFASEAVDFAIPVRVLGRNAEGGKWRWVADGGLHQLEGHAKNRIPVAKADYRFLKLEFYHYGQKAPDVDDFAAEAKPHYLVFEAASTHRPHLFFGSPRYDLDMGNPLRRGDPSRIGEDGEATLSKRHTNPLRVAGSLSEYRNTLMRLGLGIVVLLVAIVGVRAVRRRYF